MSNRAWVTLATNDSYGLGALVVAHSLRRSGSVYPAVVLITPSVTEAMSERLRAVFAEVVVVDVLDSRDAAHLALLQRPELGITFTKIHCWNLTQFEKCVFLDADTLIVQNCDELFEREELSAAPDVGWPDCFNSGVFVFRPSAETFSNLITFASERGSFDGGDQGLLNSYFADWAHGDINKHLPFLYNVTSAAFYSYIPALKHYGQNLKIIHFIGAAKPWLQHYNWQSRSVDAPEHVRQFVQLWWDLFVGQVHTQLDTTMGEVLEDPLAIIQEETVHYNEPTANLSYYEPALDVHSEFPWHHPDKQVLDQDVNVPQIDASQFFDPWDIYRGNIPAKKHDSKQTEPPTDHREESVRKYAWDYIHPQPSQYHTEIHNNENMLHDKQHNAEYQKENHNCEHKEDVRQTSHNTNQMNVHLDVPHGDYTDNYDSQHHLHEHNYGVPQYHHDSTPTTHHSPNHYHMQEHNYSEQQHVHEHHYSNINTFQVSKNIFNEPQTQSQINYQIGHTHINQQDDEHSLRKKSESFSSYSQFKKQTRPELAYTVMMDHLTLNHHTAVDNVNGYESDGDSDIYEEITPRHPYDGFYLRHRMTIDSRGRKICSHEIPMQPPSPPSEISDDFEDALDSLPEEFMDKALNGEYSQTGVAGNLARVVPGAPQQQEAVDELTRRQGWEAGNIDYMGADSFDNIWAKISQTLSQPPNSAPEQPEPSKEEAQPEAISDPPSVPASAEVANEAVEPLSEKVTAETVAEAEPAALSLESEPVEKAVEDPVEKVVEATEENKVEVAPSDSAVAPVEVPKPVESETTETSAASPTDTDSKPVEESTAAEVPVPVNEAPAPEAVETPGKPEEIIPVPVEAAAVELAASAESTTSGDVKGKPELDAAEIPVVAVEALKIDEAPAAVDAVPAPVSSVPEPTSAPQVPEEPKSSEIVEKQDPVSDSPPLANTPSKEEIPGAPAAKSEERRKPAGKLQLRPPLAADPALTPDSELEDAATLAQSIIAGELRTPTVTSPTPPALTPAQPPASDSRLSVQEPAVPTPAVGAVSLSQIGVKSKPSTAARIESSVSVKTDSTPSTPESPKTTEAPKMADTPKKKIVKKVLKKDKEGASSGEAPVPPPRKKEKKPKEK